MADDVEWFEFDNLPEYLLVAAPNFGTLVWSIFGFPGGGDEV